MARSRRVLSVSNDRSLLATREMLLQRAGYEVVSAEGSAAALQVIDKQDLDLAILGHSIPYEEKRKVIQALNRRAVRTIALLRHGEPRLKEADLSIEPDPQLLLEAVKSIIGGGADGQAAQ